jgi:hypothetical protein
VPSPTGSAPENSVQVRRAERPSSQPYAMCCRREAALINSTPHKIET